MTATEHTRADAGERLDPRLLKLAWVLLIGAMAPLLDTTVTNVALHTLVARLDASVATVQWVTTGYLLAVAMTVPVTGWAMERFGGRRTWLASLALFLTGSLLCGLAWNAASLIVFRVVQGLGGGLMLPAFQTLLLRAAGGRRIGRLMAVVTLPALVGPILGPTVGGLLVDHLGWRWIFLVNVPVCATAIVLALRTIPADGPASAPRLDVTGLLLLPPALAGLVYGLARAGEHGTLGDVRTLVPTAAGAVLLAAFTVHALRARREPLVDPRLFADRGFAASAALQFFCGLAMFGAMLLLPLYFQETRGAGVVAAGLLMIPQGVGSLLARAAGGLADRVGPRPVVLAGILLTALGTLPFALAGHRPDPVLLAAALVVRGAGISMANLAVMVGAFRGLSPDRIPHASGTSRILQQLGGSFGTAVLAVVLQRSLAGPGGTDAAFGHAFTWALALTLVAIVPALALPRHTEGRGEVPHHQGRGEPRE